MKKRICFTPRITKESGTEREFINSRYLKPMIDRGFSTILLNTTNHNNEDILDLCDGFIVTGGTDIDPTYYNEDNNGLSKGIYPDADIIDKAVVLHAHKNKKPLLGICRGLQSINVFLGGSLYQDLDTKNDTHKNIPKDHMIQTTKHPLFNWPNKISVNSYHHQAIKTLAPNFDITARHDDGTIEMIVHQSLPILAVQWHPEINADSDESKIIFDAFAKFVKDQ